MSEQPFEELCQILKRAGKGDSVAINFLELKDIKESDFLQLTLKSEQFLNTLRPNEWRIYKIGHCLDRVYVQTANVPANQDYYLYETSEGSTKGHYLKKMKKEILSNSTPFGCLYAVKPSGPNPYKIEIGHTMVASRQSEYPSDNATYAVVLREK